MLNFNYELDNELKVTQGNITTPIQVQAFALSVSRLARKYADTKKMLLTPTATGAPAMAGMSPQWQQRLKVESEFVKDLPGQLQAVANHSIQDAGDAIAQASSAKIWNHWAPLALKLYSRTLAAFQGDVSKALGNMEVTGMPPVYTQMAELARVAPPAMMPVTHNGALSGYTSDDAAYLGDLDDLDLNVFGTEVPNYLLWGGAAVAAFMWWRKSQEPVYYDQGW